MSMYIGWGAVSWMFAELTPRQLSPHKLRRSQPQPMSLLQSWNLQLVVGLDYTASWIPTV